MISVFYQNVNRIRTKLSKFNQNLLNSDYDVICLTETNLNESIFDGEVVDARYNIFRRDRVNTNSSKQDGGGVLIAIKKSFQVIRQTYWDSSQEDIWITIVPNTCNDPKLNICVCYLPPDLSNSKLDEFYTNCQRVLLNHCQDDSCLIVGDFIIPEYSPMPNANDTSNSRSKKMLLLDEFMSLCHLYQSNNIPNDKGRYLDLVLSSIESIAVSEADPLSLKDKHHPALQFEIPSILPKEKKLNQNSKKRLNFTKSNYENIRYELDRIDWQNLLSDSDVDKCTDIFYEKLFEIIKNNTPYMSIKPQNYPFWYSIPLIKCIEEKNKYHRIFKKYNNPRDYDVFSLLRARSKRMIDKCYKSYVASIEDSMTDNIKSFWKFVNNRKGRVSIPNVMKLGNSSSSNGQDICEMFSKYFGSVYESNPSNSAPSSQRTRNGDESVDERTVGALSGIFVAEDELMEKIKHLDINKGAGPDEIPPYFIKRCGKELCLPLLILFNKSLSTGIFPRRWKIAHIIPIFKNGDKSRCENYRPISILSCFAKLFESVVYNHLYNFFKPVISEKQHGFVKGRSTVTNLLVYKNYLCKTFSTGGQVDSGYTDFSKAFDRVNHGILCDKLALHGIHGSLYRWLVSYLSKRSQLVVLKGFTSSSIDVPSGVPQGSHLGPLLFIIFINDLVTRLTCECLLYADDIKIFKTVNSLNDCYVLQSDLNTVSDWCKDNFMTLNIDKCFVITFTTRRQSIVHDYTIENQPLKRSITANDLGILFDDKLSFRAHYQYIVTRANQLLGFIFRSTKCFRNPRTTLYLFNSLVRSILEYGSTIWSPHYKVHTDEIERVQKKCLRMLCYRIHPGRSAITNYETRLSKFNVHKLETRREYFDFIYLYKIIHAIIDVPDLISQINFNFRYSARRSNQTGLFALQVYKNNTSFYNPLVRMARQYNELSKKNLDFDVFQPKLQLYIKKLRDILFILKAGTFSYTE
jgi:exonuclease III